MTSSIRKVFQGVASRQQMSRMFDRHVQRPDSWDGDATPLCAGEWFEIAEAEHDYMFEILPPLWISGSMFAMRELLTGAVTSVFFALRIDEAIRYFHGYCDLSDKASVETMRVAIIDRESRPLRAMTRDERLEHIGARRPTTTAAMANVGRRRRSPSCRCNCTTFPTRSRHEEVVPPSPSRSHPCAK